MAKIDEKLCQQEEMYMFGPHKTMKWFDRNLQGVRRSRRKTLARIVAGTMRSRANSWR